VGAILIVEDMAVIRELLGEVLGRVYECHMVRTAEEGLEVLSRVDVDAVITDLKLPGMSGIDFLREVRAAHPDVPVIAVTGGVAGVYERDLLESGAFGYLLKPYEVEEVESLVAGAVESRRARRGGS